MDKNIEQPQITSDIDQTPEQCRQASEGWLLSFFNNKLNFEQGKEKNSSKWDGDVKGDYIDECEGFEWMAKKISKTTYKTSLRRWEKKMATFSNV